MEDLINLPTVTSTAVADASAAARGDGRRLHTLRPLAGAQPVPRGAAVRRGAAHQIRGGGGSNSAPTARVRARRDGGGRATPTGRSQSVIVSGESGAGKTESVKFLLQFLSHACRPEHAGRAELHLRLNEANPVLEAFGCARTVFNDNSSRFGKFVDLRLDASAQLASAHVRTYLLEKWRLVARSAGECSFHVIHQLLGAASGDVARLLRGWPREASGWHYLRGAGERDTAADAQRFKELLRAVVAASAAALLAAARHKAHLAKVEEGGGGSGDDGAEQTEVVEEGGALAAAAEALGCEYDELRDALCFRCIKAGTEWVKAHNSPAAARDVRDGFAKALTQRSSRGSSRASIVRSAARRPTARRRPTTATATTTMRMTRRRQRRRRARRRAAGGGSASSTSSASRTWRATRSSSCASTSPTRSCSSSLSARCSRRPPRCTKPRACRSRATPTARRATMHASRSLTTSPRCLRPAVARVPAAGGSDQKLLDALFEAHAAHPKFAREGAPAPQPRDIAARLPDGGGGVHRRALCGRRLLRRRRLRSEESRPRLARPADPDAVEPPPPPLGAVFDVSRRRARGLALRGPRRAIRCLAARAACDDPPRRYALCSLRQAQRPAGGGRHRRRVPPEAD